MKVRNTFIIFLVSGFWHGANWTFIVWGFLNAVYFLPLLLLNKNRINTDLVAESRLFANTREVIQMLITFSLTVFAWIFFRARSVSHALEFIRDIFQPNLLEFPEVFSWAVFGLVLGFMIVEWLGRADHVINTGGVKIHPEQLF